MTVSDYLFIYVLVFSLFGKKTVTNRVFSKRLCLILLNKK